MDHFKFSTIKATQTFTRANPKIAIQSLGDGLDDVVRQPIFRLPKLGIKLGLGLSLSGTNQHAKNQRSNGEKKNPKTEKRIPVDCLGPASTWETGIKRMRHGEEMLS